MILQDEKDSRGPTVILEEKEEAFRYSKMKEKNYNHLAMFGEESCVGYKISVMIFVKEEIRKEIWPDEEYIKTAPGYHRFINNLDRWNVTVVWQRWYTAT